MGAGGPPGGAQNEDSEQGLSLCGLSASLERPVSLVQTAVVERSPDESPRVRPPALGLELDVGLPRCPFCEEAIEVDGLRSEVEGMVLDWRPCCESSRWYVELEGFEAFAGASAIACFNASTGSCARETVEVGLQQVASYPLSSRPHRGAWRVEVADVIDAHHRHHAAPVGHLRSVVVYNGPLKVGVAVLSRPVSRMLQQGRAGLAEVTRVCTFGPQELRRGACSKLYAACASVARQLGYRELCTYTLEAEDGASLRASGFLPVARTRGGSWDRQARPRQDKAPLCSKLRWERGLVKTARPAIRRAHQAHLQAEQRRRLRAADRALELLKGARSAAKRARAERAEPQAKAPSVRVGLPYAARGTLFDAAMRVGGSILFSANAFWRNNAQGKGYFTKINASAWTGLDVSLDSAGFSAMAQGGYRWSVSEYVDFVVTNSGDGAMPFPWSWWAAMDFCCEPELAPRRQAVLQRIERTVASYDEHLCCLDDWRTEGVSDVPDPMPTLQGRTGADYVRCAKRLEQVLQDHGRAGLPDLVGLGSVCRRHLHGPQGLLTILEALDESLPAHVRLHLFGVKGALLPHVVRRFAHRVASIDSMAWDFRARWAAKEAGVPYSVQHRAAHLVAWAKAQQDKLRGTLLELGRHTTKPSPTPRSANPTPRPASKRRARAACSPAQLSLF